MKNQPIKIADVPCCVSTLTLGLEDVLVCVVPAQASRAELERISTGLAGISGFNKKNTLIVTDDIRLVQLKRLAKELEE